MSKSKTYVFFMAIAFYLVSCSSDGVDPVLLNTIKTETFTLNTPLGWQWEGGWGEDTYVGKIYSSRLSGDTIRVDQGGLAFGGVENIVEDDNTISYEQLEIGGVQTVIKKSYLTYSPEVEVILYVYIGRKGERNNKLYVLDPKNEELIIRIAKTHRFLKGAVID